MRFPRENDIGKIEYKLILSNLNEQRLQELATQMKYRLEEGGGEALYVVGVSDEGEAIGLSKEELDATINTVERVASMISAKISHKRIVKVKDNLYVGELLVRIHKDRIPIQINVAVMGHVNAGKSTLTGTLITGKLDDGNGSLRSAVARYLHEVISGRTSSITMRLLGFDNSGNPVNPQCRDPTDEAEITLKSAKTIRLIDLGGHERYLRTTLKGLMGYEVDYVMLVVGADDGLSIMGREHLAVSTVLRFPIFVVITKVDKFPESRTTEIVNQVKEVLKIPGINRLAMEVEDEGDVLNGIIGIRSKRVVPIFKVSNVTGQGLDLLIKFLNLLPPRRSTPSSDPLVYIDETYNVPGVGPVVLGSVIRGKVSINDSLLIGPSKYNEFKEIKIKSIQLNRVFVDSVNQGSIATFALQGIERDSLRKGMVLVKNKPKAVRSFWAKVILLHHPTTIKEGYVATLHLHTIRQAVRFNKIEKGILRTGDSSDVQLTFMFRSEYVEPGQIFVFREGRTRGLGIITKID
ncbi:Elongation factor 1-alpha [Metallosphaera sp. J1]|uniref:GTPBP1 family GTP-binding protein n=1 Tax=Metallosphaera javensis (ex Hofmann et al. 2022) TaxID=99938 RepID=UPI001EE10163|nr:GTP-binding protein [Metallosphaera javensis (ex Hofmann et al. 2022)]MCG3108407.1 Elongation factor 1-alpha [Metallosphaera javensis (ex Hofmann et al. 2022)]